MTTITISTVGFGEVAPLSTKGQVFTVGLIIVAIGKRDRLLELARRATPRDR